MSSIQLNVNGETVTFDASAFAQFIEAAIDAFQAFIEWVKGLFGKDAEVSLIAVA